MPTDINTAQGSLNVLGNHRATAKNAAPQPTHSSKIFTEKDHVSPSSDDSVSISDSGQKLQALESSIRSEPHVRIEVVREIQKRVQNGDFPIDVETLARKIIDQEKDF